jgi:hypothetical protein
MVVGMNWEKTPPGVTVVLTCSRFAVAWYMHGMVVGIMMVKHALEAAYMLYRTGLRAGSLAFSQPCELV